MDDATARPERHTVTPAVLGSALFVAACATFAITFVAGRGGLQMPVAATRMPVAVASEAPNPTLIATLPTATAEPTLPPPATLAPPEPTPPPTPFPTAPVPTLDPNDPLAQLPGCPGHPGCFEYVVVPGDTLTGIASRYLVSITAVLALNPELTDPTSIVVDQVPYLGRDPMARLDPCPNAEPCALYVVQRGDRLADIAALYGVTVESIRAINPGMNTPIITGDVLKLPRPA